MNQNYTIIEHLKSGKSITSWEAIQLYRITRLASRMNDIAKMGYLIAKDKICENGKRFTRYYLYAK